MKIIYPENVLNIIFKINSAFVNEIVNKGTVKQTSSGVKYILILDDSI
jgi:hypothetical protein